MRPDLGITKAPPSIITTGAPYVGVPNENQLHCLELFAGPGGLALGAHRAGFRHLALIEFEHAAADTLRANCTGLLQVDPDLVVEEDARDIDYEPYVGTVDLLTAGPPCQPFSRGGGGAGAADPRNMFPTLLGAVRIIQPRAILIENVNGLISGKFEPYFRYIIRRLQFPHHTPRAVETWEQHFQRLAGVSTAEFSDSEQYVVRHQVVDAADYGIPQRRHRVLIMAFRRDLNLQKFELRPKYSRLALLHDQWVTGHYWERHHISPSGCLEWRDEHLVKKMAGTLFPPDGLLPWRTVRDATSDLPEPVARGEKELMANHVQHPGARSYPGHLGSKLDHPAKALKAGAHGTPGGENMVQISANEVRYFTTREAARLQTFPDVWRFHGSWGACIRQLGNAVPVELANVFAKQLHRQLRSLPNEATLAIDHDGASTFLSRTVPAILPRG